MNTAVIPAITETVVATPGSLDAQTETELQARSAITDKQHAQAPGPDLGSVQEAALLENKDEQIILFDSLYEVKDATSDLPLSF